MGFLPCKYSEPGLCLQQACEFTLWWVETDVSGTTALELGICGPQESQHALSMRHAPALLSKFRVGSEDMLRLLVVGEEWPESNERCNLEFSEKIPSEDFYI